MSRLSRPTSTKSPSFSSISSTTLRSESKKFSGEFFTVSLMISLHWKSSDKDG